MSNKRFIIKTLCIAAIISAMCSCTAKKQNTSTYWAGHDFSSLKDFDDIRYAEDKFAGYVELLSKETPESAKAELRAFLDSASRNQIAYMVWTGWFASAFHAMDSPYRNDELYKAWFEMIEQDKVIDDEYMMSELRKVYHLIDLNTVGSYPENIRLCNTEDVEFQLSDMTGRKTLLLFVDANCPSCMQSLEENMKEYGRKKVRMVAVLVNGSKRHVENISKKLPESIVAGWELVWCPDRELEKGNKYDLSQLSFRMMLGADGRIVKRYF